MSGYGSVETVKVRTAATQETFGFSTEQELDDFIATNLEEASSEIDRYCNRTFRLVENHTETIQGNGSKTVQLRNYPVQTIHSLEQNGTVLSEGEDFELKDRRSFDGENNGILKRLGRGLVWRNFAEYEIEYDWGYPETEIPHVLDSVANEMVVDTLNEAEAERKAEGLENVSMDGYSVSYAVVDAQNKGVIRQEQLDRLKALRRPGIV